jgi:hypothetical protein
MLKVLIASPGDARSARDGIEKALHDWNNRRAVAAGYTLLPQRWETGSVPILGHGDAQSVINSQLVDQSDIVIAVFYHRLGSATPRAISGTAEEVNRSVAAGKPVHLYFAEKKLPHDVDIAQLAALREFRAKMQKVGLVATFKAVPDLRDQVSRAVEYDISCIRSLRENHRSTENAQPQASDGFGEGKSGFRPSTDDDWPRRVLDAVESTSAVVAEPKPSVIGYDDLSPREMRVAIELELGRPGGEIRVIASGDSVVVQNPQDYEVKDVVVEVHVTRHGSIVSHELIGPEWLAAKSGYYASRFISHPSFRFIETDINDRVRGFKIVARWRDSKTNERWRQEYSFAPNLPD